MQPDRTDVRVDPLLTNLSVGYRNAAYIADQIAPLVPVVQQSSVIPNFNQSFWFRDGAHLRKAGTKSRGGGFTTDNSAKYFADRFSFRYEYDDDTAGNVQSPYDLDRSGTEFVTDKMQMRREIAFATDFFKTGVWGADKVGGSDFTQWNDYGGSAPLVDVAAYMDDVEGRIGREANKGVIGKQGLLQLKWHPDVMDTIKYTQKAIATVDLIASLMGIDALLVGRAIYTTSKEGTAEASVTYSRIWGKHMLLVYTPPNPSLFTPAAIYTFVWQKVQGALQYIKRMRDEEREVTIIEGNSYFDQKACATRAGEFLQNIVG